MSLLGPIIGGVVQVRIVEMGIGLQRSAMVGYGGWAEGRSVCVGWAGFDGTLVSVVVGVAVRTGTTGGTGGGATEQYAVETIQHPLPSFRMCHERRVNAPTAVKTTSIILRSGIVDPCRGIWNVIALLLLLGHRFHVVRLGRRNGLPRTLGWEHHPPHLRCWK